MRSRMKSTLLLGVALAGLTALWAAAADEPPKAEGEPLLVTDNGGKEQKLKVWKITAGTRHLGWLAPAEKEADPKDKVAPKAPLKPKPVGPEALEFREENSTNFKDGILTLVPLARVRSLEYDNMAETVKLIAATGPKAEDTTTLTGATKFAGINKLVIEAEVDKGDLGIAEVKFLGGVPKGINAVKFPSGAKIEATPAGRTATVTTKADSKGKTTHQVSDLQALYRTGGGEKLSPLVFFKKTIKIDLAKVSKITVTDVGVEPAWSLTMKAGGDETLTPLTTPLLDGKPALLVGFVGRVPAGYQLFSIHILEEVEFDAK